MQQLKRAWWAGLLMGLLTLGLSAGPAGAQAGDDPYERPPSILPDDVERDEDDGAPVVLDDIVSPRTVDPAVSATPVDAGTASTLPVTGGDAVALAVIGTAALALGGGLVLASRRRTNPN